MTLQAAIIIVWILLQDTTHSVMIDQEVYEIVKFVLSAVLIFVFSMGVKELGSLRQSINELRSAVVTLEILMKRTETDISELKGDVRKIQGRVAAHDSDLSAIKEELQNIEKRS